MRRVSMLLWLAFAATSFPASPAGAQTIYPPAGPYISPGWSDFSGSSFLATDPVVATNFFYWYNVFTGEHMVNPNGSDALADHPVGSAVAPVAAYPPNASYQTRPPSTPPGPPGSPSFSYTDPNWFALQHHNMRVYGIDVILPDYWGQPGIDNWTSQGLRQLDVAMDNLQAQGAPLLKVGLFYDNTTMSGWDLANPTFQELFYETIRDFYSIVKPSRWFRIDGRVVVWIYSSAWPANISPAAFTHASNRFAQEFGGHHLYFIGDSVWRTRGCPFDQVYTWGAAITGTQVQDVAALGPGFNNAAVNNGTGTGYRDRGGAANTFYSSSWVTAHQSGRPLVALETWNEYHEGSVIAPSVEWGYRDHAITVEESARHHFNGYFTKQGYGYFLGRLPDWGGNITWTAATYNASPAYTRDSLVNSAEAKARTSNASYVTFLYNRYLHRAPDPGGFQGWVNQLNSGLPRYQARDGFLNSAEARGLISNAQFVTELYRQILLREPDSGGFQNWLNQLNAGAPRSAVRENFINSVEIRYRNLAGLTAVQQRSLFDFSGWPAE